MPHADKPLLYACSGCSSAAQMANHLAVKLDRDGAAEMSCIAGVGGDVPSLVAKEPGAACGCRGVEVLLQVREDDLAEVLRVLALEHWESTGLADHDTCPVDAVYNPEEGEAVCPACGSRFSTSLAECPDCGLCFA